MAQRLTDIVNGFIGGEPQGNFNIENFLNTSSLPEKDLKKKKKWVEEQNFPSHKYDLNSGSFPSIVGKNFMETFSNSDKKYRKAKEFIQDESGKRKETERILQNGIQVLGEYLEQYKEAYKDAEKRLKQVDSTIDQIDEDYKNMREEYDQELENHQKELENNERWSSEWISGYFGKGYTKFKQKFLDINHAIEKTKYKTQKKPLVGRKRTIQKKFDKIANEYEDIRDKQVKIDQEKTNAENYLLEKKGPFSGGSPTSKDYFEDVKDFFGF